jgi:hypothetical protein
MAFVVEGSDWVLDGRAPDEVLDAIEDFLELLARASADDVTVWFGDDFSARPMLGNSSIWDLCDEASEIHFPTEVWQELAAHLGRAKLYVDEPEWPARFPENVDVSINGGPTVTNIDVAWAHHNVLSGKAVACVGLWRRGVFETAIGRGVAELHWIGHGPSAASEFWQCAIELEGNSPASFERFATLAYPRLHFAGEVLHQADEFAGGYHAIANVLKYYLKRLDESGHWAFTAAPPAESRTDPPGPEGSNPSNQLIQRRLAPLDVAPENPNVYANTTCRTARQIQLEGRTLYCEWHCKLEPHRNRVHIHAPVPESNDKLVIAIFAEHLPLP